MPAHAVFKVPALARARLDWALLSRQGAAIGWLIGDAADKMRGSKPALTPNGKPKVYRRRRVQRRPKGYRPQQLGECVGLDAIDRRMGGVKRYILTDIDEVSDYALALAVPRLNSRAAAMFLERCIKLTPFALQQVAADSGGEFRGSFDQRLKDSDITHLWTYPKTPKMNRALRALQPHPTGAVCGLSRKSSV